MTYNPKYHKQYYLSNKRRIAEARHERYLRNLEKEKLYALKNKDKISEGHHLRRLSNLEVYKERDRQYYLKNRQRRLEYQKLYNATHKRYNKLKNNPRYIVESRIRGRLRKILQTKPTTTRRDLVGCSNIFLIKYLESKFQDGMSWDNRHLWHIDHIKPCASFDLSKVEEQKKCFHYSNLQPLWATENMKKGKKYEGLMKTIRKPVPKGGQVIKSKKKKRLDKSVRQEIAEGLHPSDPSC